MNTRGRLAMVSETTPLQINFVNDSAEIFYACVTTILINHADLLKDMNFILK